MKTIPYNFLLIFLLVGLNGFFVAAEYALLTLRKTKVDQYVRQKIIGYSIVRKAMDNLYAVISATQLGSTICSILLGWFAEPMVEKLLLPLIRLIPIKQILIVDRSISIVITIVLLSFFQMIFGEIIPKTIALQKSDILSRILIIPLNGFIFILSPLIAITNGVSNLFLKLIHLRPFSKRPVDYTQEEIRIILDESMKNRILPHHQAQLLSNIFALQRIPITKIMIERNKLLSFFHNDSLGAIKKKIAENKQTHNRYPIYFSKNLIIGFIHLSDVLRFPNDTKKNIKLNETNLIREILHVSETYPADKLLIQMREKGIHAAVIKNQDQELLGIITITDIVEFLVKHR